MKTFYCRKCGKKVLKLEKGKMRMGAVVLCKECNSMVKLAESTINGKKPDFGDLFGGTFK